VAPLPSELVSKTLAWARSADDSAERIQFHSEEDVAETPALEPPARRRTQGVGLSGGDHSEHRPKWEADCGAACGVLGDDLISFASGNQQALQELSERTAAIESQAPP